MNVHKLIKTGVTFDAKKVINSSNINSRDQDGQTPLHIASFEGNLVLVRYLISKKADVNAVDVNGWTALHCACSKPNLQICEVLLSTKHIDIHKQNNDSTTAFAYLVRHPLDKISKDLKLYLYCLKMMKVNPEIVNATNRFGEPLIMTAVIRGNFHSINFLLTNGADVNNVNSKKETALFWAIKLNKNPTYLKSLINFGADPFMASQDGITPMELAMKSSDKEVINILTKRAFSCSEAKKDCTKADWMEFYFLKEWKKLFFILQDVILFAYPADDPNCKPVYSFEVLDTQIDENVTEKKARSKPFCFLMSDENKASLFSAKNDVDKIDWVNCLQQAKRIHSNILIKTLDAAGIEAEPANQEDPIPRLIGLLQQHENMYCADCNSTGVNWLEVKYGITICNDCARCHYNIAMQLSLPVETIKSLHFNSLSLSDVMVLKCNGNAKHNAKMESNIPNNIWKPTPQSSIDDKTTYIKLKYIEKSFSSGNPSSHSEYRRSIGARISNFEQHYSLSFVLESISITPSYWTKLKSNSEIYKKITLLLSGKESEAQFYDYLKQKLGKISMISIPLLSTLLPILRSIYEYPNGYNEKNMKDNLKKFLLELQQTQQHINDPHFEAIIKWWLPQTLEVIAIQKLSNFAFDLNGLIKKYLQHSIEAFYMLTSEYISYPSFISNIESGASAAASSENVKFHDQIRTKISSHVENVRKIVSVSTKTSSGGYASLLRTPTDPSDRSDPLMRRTDSSKLREEAARASQTFSAPHSNTPPPPLSAFAVVQTSSYSGNDSSDLSPRSHDVDHFCTFEPNMVSVPHISACLSDHPALFPNLSLVISETVPPKLQLSILGLIDCGVSYLERPNINRTENFSLLSNTSTMLVKFKSLLPIGSIQADTESSSSLLAFLLRYLLILRHDIMATYAKPFFSSSPEVWDCWQSLIEILSDGLTYFGICIEKGEIAKSIRHVDIIGLLVTQIRWTVTSLTDLND